MVTPVRVRISASVNPCDGHGWSKRHNDVIFRLYRLLVYSHQIRSKPSDIRHKIAVRWSLKDGHGYRRGCMCTDTEAKGVDRTFGNICKQAEGQINRWSLYVKFEFDCWDSFQNKDEKNKRRKKTCCLLLGWVWTLIDFLLNYRL